MNSNVVILAELDIGQSHKQWVNYSPGVWWYDFNLAFESSNFHPDFLNGFESKDIQDIGSVLAGDVLLRGDMGSIALVQSTEKSFYYDGTLSRIYLRCPDDNCPSLFKISIGLVYGWKKGGEVSYYNDINYKSQLKNIPNISRKKAIDFLGKVQNLGGSYTVINNGEYDKFAKNNKIYGNQSRLYIGQDGDDKEDFFRMYTGYVYPVNINLDDMRIDLKTPDKQLSKTIPENIFDSTTYPDINEENINKPIPLLYGHCRNVPVICVNEDEAGPPVNYTFKICDTTYHSINSIDTVYIDGVVEVPGGTNLTNATFTIASGGNYSPGDEVTATVKGYEDSAGNLIDGGLDIIQDLLDNYYDVSRNNNFYNLSHWDVIDQLDLCLFINDFTSVNETIDRLAKSTRANFYIEGDGRYAGRIFNKNEASSLTITKEQILKISQITQDPTQVVSSIITKYDPNWNTNNYRQVIYDDDEANIFEDVKTYKSKQYTTLIKSSADVVVFNEYMIDLLGSVNSLFNIEVSIIIDDIKELEIGDTITVELTRPNAPGLGNVDCEVIGKTLNLNSYRISFDLRITNIEVELYWQGAELWYEKAWGEGAYYDSGYVEVNAE